MENSAETEPASELDQQIQAAVDAFVGGHENKRNWIQALCEPLRYEPSRKNWDKEGSSDDAHEAFDAMHIACCQAISRIARSVLPMEGE